MIAAFLGITYLAFLLLGIWAGLHHGRNQGFESARELFQPVTEGDIAGNAHRDPYDTLGDIAQELRIMKEHGMTRASIEYALSQVYFKGEV